MSEWQPIETIPTQQRILVYAGPIYGVRVERWIGAPHNIWVTESDLHVEPRAWMPIPEPPK